MFNSALDCPSVRLFVCWSLPLLKMFMDLVMMVMLNIIFLFLIIVQMHED